MKVSSVLYNCFLLLLVMPCLLTSQTLSNSISFNEYFDVVKKEHPLVKKAKSLVDIGRYQANSAQGLFDPQVNASINNKYFSNTNYYTQAGAEIKQPIYSGQSIKAGYEYGYGPQINPEQYTPLVGLPYLGVEFSVLQGLVIDKKRYEVLKAKQYRKLLETESKIELNDLYLQSTEIFVNWLKDYTITDVNKRFLEAANERLEALVTLSEIGERPAVDTIEALILNQSREIDFTNSQINLNKSYFLFVNFIWANDSNTKSKSFLPLQSINELTQLCLAKLVQQNKIDVQANPFIDLYTNKAKLLNLERRYKAELIKPKLDVTYNFLANNAVDFNNNQSNTYFLNNYKWGAGFSMPLFLRTSVNDLRVTKQNLKNNTYELTNKSAELNNKLSAVLENLNLLAQQIETAQKTFNYSKLLLEAEKLKFQNNESSLFLLNTRENKVLESEIKLIETQTKFTLTYFYLVYLKGDLAYEF